MYISVFTIDPIVIKSWIINLLTQYNNFRKASYFSTTHQFILGSCHILLGWEPCLLCPDSNPSCFCFPYAMLRSFFIHPTTVPSVPGNRHSSPLLPHFLLLHSAWSLSHQTTASLYCVFPYLPLLMVPTRLQFFLSCVLPVPHCATITSLPDYRTRPLLSVFSYSMLQFLLYILHFSHTSLF